MHVLVTGIGGFAGPVVAAELLARGHRVTGLVRRPAGPRLAGLPVALATGDLLDAGVADRVVAEASPDAIIHLAGLTSAPAAEADPPAAYRDNVHTLLALLAAVRTYAPRVRLLVVSSSEVYGLVGPRDLPVTEATPLRPVSVYGASKVAAEVAAGQWSRAHGLDVVCARAFNHTGAGQTTAFVCPALARQIALIEAGRQEPILHVGNADAVRDFSDAHDVAAGYAAVLERGRTGETYNLCSGEGVSIAEVIALLRTHARVPLRVHSDPVRRRLVDVPRLVGSADRAARDLGWHARIALSDTLAAVLDDWRARIDAPAPA
ncbi:MAG: GDP-mannose 4,6-dehydratase [Candidatus Binatia bacterium]